LTLPHACKRSARAGESGRGFAVVADEVRKLSQETEAVVRKINDSIGSVAATIENQFKDKLARSDLDEERDGLRRFAEQLGWLGESYERLTKREQSTLATIADSSRRLGEMFINAMASVQFQDLRANKSNTWSGRSSASTTTRMPSPVCLSAASPPLKTTCSSH